MKPARAVLVPNTRRWFIHFSGGPSYWITGNFEGPGSRLKVEQMIGRHMGSDLHNTTAIAFVMQESFGSEARDILVAPRILWDLSVSETLGVYVSPSVTMGYAVRILGIGDTSNNFDFQFAAGVKFVLANRLQLSFRPVSFEVISDFASVGLRWDILGGFGLTF